MKIRKVVIRMVLVFIGLPMVLVLIAAVSFYVLMSFYALNQTNGSIVSSGQKREYLLYVQKSYNPAQGEAAYDACTPLSPEIVGAYCNTPLRPYLQCDVLMERPIA